MADKGVVGAVECDDLAGAEIGDLAALVPGGQGAVLRQKHVGSPDSLLPTPDGRAAVGWTVRYPRRSLQRTYARSGRGMVPVTDRPSGGMAQAMNQGSVGVAEIPAQQIAVLELGGLSGKGYAPLL
jgi:hypothetical protein